MHAHAPISSIITSSNMSPNTEQRQDCKCNPKKGKLGTRRSVHEFQPSRADEALHGILSTVALLPPPSLEKLL
jgi:hypothetical protein